MDAAELEALYPEAWAYLDARKVELSPRFYARLDALRAQAWTISRLETLEQIQELKDSLLEALKQGQSFAEWKKNMPAAALGLRAAHRETVFRNAMQSSYNGAKWAQFRDSDSVDVLRYMAIGDHRTRPSHRALHGLMMPKDDPRWAEISPPGGHRCRCTLVGIPQRQLERYGYRGAPAELPTWTDENGIKHRAAPDPGWRQTPENADLMRQLREKERRLGLPPAQLKPVPLKALPSLPLAPELRRKMLDSALKSVDFSGIKPQKSEIKRLLRQGLRPGEARLAAQWQQHFKVRLVGFLPEYHALLTHQPPDLVEAHATLPEIQWRTLDIMYSREPKLNIKEFIKEFSRSEIAWRKSKENIMKHLRKAHIVPMFMGLFDKETASKIIEFMLTLSEEQQSQIVMIWGD